jgi:hypothetical protein
MEFLILEMLDYNITFPTSYNFMGILIETDDSTEETKKTASYILLKTLCDHKFVNYKPSIIAASVIYYTKKMLGIAPYWSLKLKNITNYKVKNLIECINDIKKIPIDFDSLKIKIL